MVNCGDSITNVVSRFTGAIPPPSQLPCIIAQSSLCLQEQTGPFSKFAVLRALEPLL